MKNIFYIFFRDVRSIVKNWALLIIILGLVFLPSLYAWFNILASWDPYGNTGNISVAVVNQDQGAVFRGRSLKIGDEIIASLRKNKHIGWVFTDESNALRGVNHGDFYASILIPADFSKNISSFLTEIPQKAEIDYTVNEKINAIAPKITAKGASGIVEQVRKNFIQTANGTIFSIFNEIGIELEQERPTIEKVSNLILKLEGMMPEIHNVVVELVKDMSIANRLITNAQSNLAMIADEVNGYKEFINRLGTWLDKGSDVLSNTAGPHMKTNLILLRDISAGTKQLSDSMMDPAIDPAVVNTAIDRSIRHISNGILVTQTLSELLERMNGIIGENRLQYAVNRSKELNTNLTKQLSMLNQIKDRVGRGEEFSGELAASLNGLATRSETILDDLISRFDSEILPKIQDGFDRVKSSSDKAAKILQSVSQDIPEVQKILGDAERGVTVGNRELHDIQRKLPAIESKIKDLANVIRKLEKEGTLNELIDLLKNNAEREGQFFAEPVTLKEHKLFPIPNYGSAMSPFFTTLSLWVGALLLVSLLSVEVHDDQKMFKAYQVYLGRYLTFLVLAVLQSLSISLGDLFILKTYVTDKIWFILFAMLLSSIFMLIVYTFVSVFGNVGKAMAIVLLVLQLAGSGGTFPIQVTPPFFQVIYPLLPFTYAISLMREAAGGILWDIVRHDLLYLSGFVTIMLLLGLTLKDLVNRSTAKFVKKAKEGKLIH